MTAVEDRMGGVNRGVDVGVKSEVGRDVRGWIRAGGVGVLSEQDENLSFERSETEVSTC